MVRFASLALLALVAAVGKLEQFSKGPLKLERQFGV